MPPPCGRTQQCALVLDAGSSGSRLRIFEWSNNEAGTLPPIRAAEFTSTHALDQAACLRKRPGLSSFARQPELAGSQAKDLIDCAAAIVPADYHARTPLFVKATAGLRLLRQPVADAILIAVRTSLHSRQCMCCWVRGRAMGRAVGLPGSRRRGWGLGRSPSATGYSTGTCDPLFCPPLAGRTVGVRP